VANTAIPVSSLALAPPPQDLVLSRYRPVRPLGSGGNGSVWLALDEQTGLDVALKIIPREGKGAARAEREALAARRLRHDRCVRAYDVGHEGSHVYIAYEYVPGRTIREALQTSALSERDVVEVAAQVLDALAHAHRAGIVHRDVKPSNMLLENGDGVAVRLLDFGLAQFDGADTLTAVGDVPGTLAYIAPERLAGEEATAASDVWAVGVFLWEALAGRHPFWGMPLQQVAQAIEAGAPPLATERRNLPRRLLAAVDRALDPDPEARPRASELAAELRAALKTPAKRPDSRRSQQAVVPRSAPAASFAPVATRVSTSALAAATAGLGATLLPFWPPVLVIAIVVAAGAAGFLKPRLALAMALAAPIFPLGNEARSAAIVYGCFAVAWLVMTWADARRGLLFVLGPLLAPLGSLALVPLAVQPARGVARRGAQGALAILTTALVAGTSGSEIPFAHVDVTVDLVPASSASDVLLAVQDALAGAPLLVLATIAAGGAAAGLPFARAASRFGVAAVGLTITIAALAAGAPLASAPLVLAVWAVPAVLAARARRSLI
jgi:eukaryotic-like serine/threonine-protein kinase